MKIDVLAHSYDRYGGASSVSPVGHYLSRYLGDIVPVDLEIEVTASFRTERPPRKTLERMQEDFHRSLERMPTVRFISKTNKLMITYYSRSYLAETALEYGPPSLEVFVAITRELAELLSSVLKRHKALKAMVDHTAFAAACTLALRALPTDVTQLRAFVADATQQASEAIARLTPWERLDIDWSQYHPDARTILDDPFYWDAIDDYAPHGNDTGADLLQDFRIWRRSHRATEVSRFLPSLLRRWGFELRVLTWSNKPLADWTKDDALTLDVYDEATVALAFAQLKLEAVCDSDVRQAALDSIARQLDPEVAGHFGWNTPPDRVARLQMLRGVLTKKSGA